MRPVSVGKRVKFASSSSGTADSYHTVSVGRKALSTGDGRWDTLSNGELLSAAEEAGFELLLTTDRRIRYQQNLRVRRIALIVLTGSTKWSRVRQHADRIAAAVAATIPGSYTEVATRFEPTLGGD